jgi:Kef-type K+ transport system membrane component KefB
VSGAYEVFALLLLIAAAVGALAVRLRQPLIVAFILVGIVVGPAGTGWVTGQAEIELLAQIGVTVLLFVVGLKLDVHLVRNIGPVALATGLGQLGFTILFGYLICAGLGMPPVTALYVAVALTFSSTIIIVKLLSDKREIDSLHGRIAMGFLIVQDIAVVVAMMLLGSLNVAGADAAAAEVVMSIVLKIGLAAVAVFLLMRYVLPWLLHLLARSQELLLLFAVAWGTALAALGEHVGFSKEVGAFLAGFSLASTPYREPISTRLTSLRDFLLLFFFIDLGAKLELSTLGAEVGSSLMLSLFVLIGNPLIVMAIMGYMGYRKRTGFLAGLTVAQISEFSIIFVVMGISLGHVGADTLGLVTMVGLVTITLSTYLILYSHPLYGYLAPWLVAFERANPFREAAVARQQRGAADPDVIVYGLGRFGSRLAAQLRERRLNVLGVDFDPEAVRERHLQGLEARFGDAEDPEFPETLPLGHARWVVSTLPQAEINLALLGALRHHGYRGAVAMAAHTEKDATALTGAGVDRVFLPFVDAADFAARVIVNNLLGEEGTP